MHIISTLKRQYVMEYWFYNNYIFTSDTFIKNLFDTLIFIIKHLLLL